MPTIADVARRAGVANVTVSRVINGAAHVDPATRERVEQAIRELGYVPNAAARSLRSQCTRSLALLVPDITNPFWTTVARGVEDAAQSRGYSVLLGNTDEDPAKQARYLDAIASQRVDGVIVAPHDTDPSHLARLRERGIPTVIIDRRVDGWQGDSVRGDSVGGARALVSHLIGLGHRRIAAIAGPRHTSTAADRVAGYRQALEAAGIPVEPRYIRWGEFRASTGERLTREILDEGLDVTAIFAANNAIAVGALTVLRATGRRVPQDVALVCFDDLPDASRIYPFLTVAAQPAREMGERAAELLLSRLQHMKERRVTQSGLPAMPVDLPAREVVLPVRLILRYSCGRLGEANAPAAKT